MDVYFLRSEIFLSLKVLNTSFTKDSSYIVSARLGVRPAPVALAAQASRFLPGFHHLWSEEAEVDDFSRFFYS